MTFRMTLTRRTSLSLLLAGAMLLAITPAQGPAMAQAPGVTAQEILIGAFGPLSGGNSWIGLSARDGLQLALNEINEHGGVNGRKLRMIFEGAQTPAESVGAAKKLVEQDRVFVLVLGSGSTGAAAAADYVREGGIPTYNIVGATPKIRNPFARNVFSGVYPDASLISQYFAAEVMNTKPAPKTASIVVGTYEFPQAVYKGLLPHLQKAGLSITTTQSFDLATKDFTAQLVAVAQNKPDVVVFLGTAAEAGLAIKQAPELGLVGTPWVIDLAGISPSVPLVAGKAAEGVRSIWMFPYYFGDPAKPMQDFEKKWQAAYGQPSSGRPSYIDINGYGDMYVLALALRAAGKDLSWPALISTWEQLKDLKPTDFGPYASDVIFPESFSPTDRDGNKRYTTIKVTNGAWRVVH
jgi:branched-chain amino acid transport system substrate-binding protein